MSAVQSGVKIVQIHLVCGGEDGSGNYLSSCEQNIAGTSVWTSATALPRTLAGLRGVTLDDKAFMIG